MIAHRPESIVCECGAKVPWGRFDKHAHDATKADLINDMKRQLRSAGRRNLRGSDVP